MKLRTGTNGKNERVLVICEMLEYTTVTESELIKSIEHWHSSKDLDEETGYHWAVKDSYYEFEEPRTLEHPGISEGWVIENFKTFDELALLESDELDELTNFIDNHCEVNSFKFNA